MSALSDECHYSVTPSVERSHFTYVANYPSRPWQHAKLAVALQ